VGRLQLALALLDPGEHLVERVVKRSQLVVCAVLDPNGVIALRGDATRGLGQVENRQSDRPL
jgi:hypothetical protein